MKTTYFALCLSLVILLGGCQSQQQEPTEIAHTPPVKTVDSLSPTGARHTSPTFSLLSDSIIPLLVENPAQVLARWRQFKDDQPTLLLYSADPFLQPLPEKYADQIIQSLDSATSDDFNARAMDRIANPLLRPTMTTRAALKLNLFPRIVWELPTPLPMQNLTVKSFQEQLVNFGALSQETASRIVYAKGVFSGRINEVPFQARHPQATSPIEGPVIVHFDLSYFSPLYKGEIKTPLYSLIYNTLIKLRRQHVKALAVTISYSNLNGRLPLATRFVGPDLATLFQHPERLNQKLPPLWQQRSSTLFLPNFFQSAKAEDILKDMDNLSPNSPDIKYALYQVHRELKNSSKALDELAQAVALDRSYAMEYLALSSVAKKKKLPKKELEMLQLAAENLPEDPFIKLQIATLLLKTPHKDQGLEILSQLQRLDWSPAFYPTMKAKLEKLRRQAEL